MAFVNRMLYNISLIGKTLVVIVFATCAGKQRMSAQSVQSKFKHHMFLLKTCLKMECKCKHAIVLVVLTDCKDCNKKALETINRMREDGSISSDYLLLATLPDVMHVGKSIKCSWANWFILLDGQRSNFVLVHTLRDSTDPDVRKKLRKLLTLECV